MRITNGSSFFIAASTLALTAHAEAAQPVQLWVRAAGVYGKKEQDPAKQSPQTVDLESLPQKQEQRTDVQYGSSAYYRGVALSDIWAKYTPPKGTDLALLHFHNGVVIPLPFRDAATMKRVAPFVALSRSTTAEGPYRTELPPVNKSVEGYADVRQVAFSGNKIVVADGWHPEMTEAALANFSPWRLAGSLTGIEFVEGTAYYRQFVPSADVRPGFEVFRQNCQFCHGVNKVGAHFGWDYATPLPLHTYRSTEQKLYMHIAYRVEYKATWQQMPALKHVSQAEAGLLWQWMRAVSSAPMTRYTPTR
ncbi:MAG: cytochrome c [Myxococcales bacterium]|nr:cytochrome c [Myxococcales bacterium]